MASQLELNNPEYIEYIEHRIEKYDSSSKPKMIFMVGGPGSGKSSGQTHIMSRLKFNKEDFISIDPDQILGDLFDMNNIKRPIVNKINDELYEIAKRKRLNIIYDKTGKNLQKSLSVIEDAAKFGYSIYICIVITDSEIAKARAKIRQIQTGRNVPNHVLNEIYRSLNTIYKDYIYIRHKNIKGVYVYRNDENFKLLLISKHGVPTKIYNYTNKILNNILIEPLQTKELLMSQNRRTGHNSRKYTLKRI
jgi:predicted ABC-type ATPase